MDCTDRKPERVSSVQVSVRLPEVPQSSEYPESAGITGMAVFGNSKPTRQIELEKKIKALRDAGMVASAERLESQLNYHLHRTDEKITPMKPQELAKQAKAQKAAGVKS